MFESLVTTLIYLCLVVGACWLVIWVLGQLGVALPAQVIKIFWVIVVLVCILILYRMLAPALHLGRIGALMNFPLLG